MQNNFEFAVSRVIDICLVILFAGLPLIINPTAFDYWYKPKAESMYALIVIIISAAILQHFFTSKTFRLRSRPLTIPLAAYGFSAIISTIFSISHKLSIYGDLWRLENIFTILSYIMLTFIFSSLVRTKEQADNLIKYLLVSSSIVAIYGIIQYAGYNPTKHFIPLFRADRIKSTVGNANFLSKFMVLVLPLFMAFFIISEKKIRKFLIFSGFILCTCTLILTFTRASWLGFAVSATVFLLMTGKNIFPGRIKKAPFLLISVLLLIFLSGSFIVRTSNRIKLCREIKGRIVSSFDTEHGMGVATRLFVWKRSLQLIGKSPFIGYGPDTQVKIFRKFNLEYNKKFNNWVVIDRAHNNYIDITLSRGFLGLLTYLSIIVVFMSWLWKTIKSEKAFPQKILLTGIFAAFCGCLVNDIFIFSDVSVSPIFWSLMGLTIAMKQVKQPMA